MRFSHSDPDIETIVRRIERGLIDLQPDFQRGNVWTTGRKQRLMDTILRGWHIPPVHLVKRGDGGWDVLDGQQRLSAIRDFKTGLFALDGSIEPTDGHISLLDGMRWGNLPQDIRDQFDSFTIRVFELTDYTAKEPHELFFRLNQPTNLTEAEKRNAFIGPARNQVKHLAEWAESEGMDADLVGFGGTRMAYDDTLSRFLLTLESKTISQKVTAGRITERYRSEAPFAEDVISVARGSLATLLRDLGRGREQSVRRLRLNKATFHTWLVINARCQIIAQQEVIDRLPALSLLEAGRGNRGVVSDAKSQMLLSVYDDRATSRVADVSSVLLRDVIAWYFVWQSADRPALPLEMGSALQQVAAWQVPDSQAPVEDALLRLVNAAEWGGLGWV